MRSYYFIEASKLGVLEHQFERAIFAADSTKRKRSSDFKRLARVLRDLRLVPAEVGEIIDLSLGIRPNGEKGLFVNCFTPTVVQVEVP